MWRGWSVHPTLLGAAAAELIVLGTLTPDRGDVLWDGSPIGFEVRRRIGYMPEERGLYPKIGVAIGMT